MRWRLFPIPFAVAACGIDAVGTAPSTQGVVVPALEGGASDATTPANDGGPIVVGPDGATLGPYTAAVLADAPIAYWRLEESMGPAAADQRATYPATVDPSGVFGRPGALSSQPSTAVLFDGASTSIAAAAPMPFDGTKPFSIEAWIRPLLVDGANRWFFVWGDPSNTTIGAIELAGSNNNVYFVRTSPAGAQDFFLTATLAFGVYTHVVVTYDGAMQRFYSNGVEVRAAASAVALGGPAGYEVRWGTRIGGNFFKFDGEMDELALYATALSAARVKAHFDAR